MGHLPQWTAVDGFGEMSGMHRDRTTARTDIEMGGTCTLGDPETLRQCYPGLRLSDLFREKVKW